MKLAVNQKAFAALLDRAKRIVPARTTIAILNHVVLRAANGRLSIEATDLQVSFRASIEAAIEREGAVTAAGRQLADIVSRLSQPTLTIEDKDHAEIVLTAGRSSYRLSSLLPRDFSMLEPPTAALGEISIAGAEWTRMIERVQHAVIRDNARPMLEGANLSHADGHLRLVATDGHRLSLTTADPGGFEIVKPFDNITIPTEALSHMATLAKDLPRVTITIDDRCIALTSEAGATFTSLLLDSTYPDWQRLFQDEKPFTMVVDREDLTSAVTRLTSLTSESSRMLRFSIDAEAGSIAIETSRNVTEAYGCEIASIVGGETLQSRLIGLNGRLLQDALNVAPPGNMQIGYDRSNANSLHLAIVDHPEWRGLIMPMDLGKGGW